jgi:hypothetical protein
MYFCYIDESGTPEIPGTTTHFVLTGLAIPSEHWSNCEQNINDIKNKYCLDDSEIHTGWILRKYREQFLIPDFEKLNHAQRRIEVDKLRKAELYKWRKSHLTKNKYKQNKKNYSQTKDYIHLTLDERKNFIKEIATAIGNWGFARLFAECIDKKFFIPSIAFAPVDAQAFEQVVSRFEQFLEKIGKEQYGILIYDNNLTVAKKHTELMKSFHKKGTIWTKIHRIIETPFFVNSELTSMIQIADVCSYSIRRYLENNESELFDEVIKRADTHKNGVVVGIRHFSEKTCDCKICVGHKPKVISAESSS